MSKSKNQIPGADVSAATLLGGSHRFCLFDLDGMLAPQHGGSLDALLAIATGPLWSLAPRWVIYDSDIGTGGPVADSRTLIRK